MGRRSEQLQKCDCCPYVTFVRSHLTRHKKCHGNMSKQFVCPHPPCDFRAGNQANLNSHAKIHIMDTPRSSGTKTPRTQGPQKSNFVLQLLARAKSKAKMKLKVRSNVGIFHATRNSKGQLASKNPQKNISKVVQYSASKYKYTCSDCGFGTNRKDNIKRHSAIHDANRPTFPCPTCLKTFSRQDGVWKHQRKSCHRNPPTLAVLKLSISPQILSNEGYEVPEMFVIDEIDHGDDGAEDEVAEDAAGEDAEDENVEDVAAGDGVAEDVDAEAEDAAGEVAEDKVAEDEVAELPERDPEMPEINDICYRTETDEQQNANLEEPVEEPTTDLIRKSDGCARCSLFAKLPHYLRKHMKPCADCSGKT